MASSCKVLLIEDVLHLGRSGEIKDVAAGFARNYLLPKQYAVIADKATLRLKEKLQKQRAEKAEQDKQESLSLASQVQNLILTQVVKVDPDGHMYGSVSAADIVKLFDQEGYSVAKQFIDLHSPIKKTGVHEIHLNLKEGVNCAVKLKVLAEEQANTDVVAQEETEQGA